MSASITMAVIALIRSAAGADAMLAGRATDHEPWPEMDALIAALDAERPGWRTWPPQGWQTTGSGDAWTVCAADGTTITRPTQQAALAAAWEAAMDAA